MFLQRSTVADSHCNEPRFFSSMDGCKAEGGNDKLGEGDHANYPSKLVYL